MARAVVSEQAVSAPCAELRPPLTAFARDLDDGLRESAYSPGAMRIWLFAGGALLVSAGALWSCGSSEEGADDGTAGAGAYDAAAGQGGDGSGGTSGSGGLGGASGGAGGSAGAGAIAGTSGSGGSSNEIDFDLSAIPESASSFPVGVQAGDLTSSSAILWTHQVGTAPLTLRVYEPTNPGKALVHHEANVTASPDGYVHVDASPLPAHTELFYVFLEGNAPTFSARSRIGRFVTAPLPGQRPKAVFGGTSCIKNDRAPFETLAIAAGKQLDFFVLGGDNTYNDPATTLAEYRGLWLGQLGDSGYRSLLQSTGHYATWDDHEVDNDWNPELISQTRLAAATQTFFEHLAIRRDITFPNRVWRRYAWGDTIDVFVLDSRSERKPSTIISQNPQYISPEQMTWLKDGLKSSTATFKLIVNSVPITNFPHLFDFASIDRWEGYGAQRAELLDAIVQNGVTGVLFVSGDFHLGASAAVEGSGPWSGLREVLMGPGDQKANPLWNTLPSPQFEFTTGTSNVTLFEADPEASPPTIRVTFVDGKGNTLFDKTYAF
jgi:alkaline phosphatase D